MHSWAHPNYFDTAHEIWCGEYSTNQTNFETCMCMVQANCFSYHSSQNLFINFLIMWDLEAKNCASYLYQNISSEKLNYKNSMSRIFTMLQLSLHVFVFKLNFMMLSHFVTLFYKLHHFYYSKLPFDTMVSTLNYNEMECFEIENLHWQTYSLATVL